MLSLDLGINKNKVTLNIFIPCQFHTCIILYFDHIHPSITLSNVLPSH